MSAIGEPARVVPWLTVAGWCAFAALPVALAVPNDEAELAIPVALAASILGAACASAIDDPAQVTLAAVPVPRGRRRLARLGWTALALIGTALALAGAVEWSGRDAGIALSDLLAVSAVCAAGGLAIAGRLPDDAGFSSPGVAGSGSALLGLLVVIALSTRVSWLPMIGDPADTNRWWLLAAACALAAAPAFRDPAARRWRPVARLRRAT